MSVTCDIRNYNILQKHLEDMQKAPKTVMRNLTSDARKRVPGWVATEVSKTYGVKKNEITGNKIGTMKVKGGSFKQLKIIYRGRVLTPLHFNMSPKVPKIGGSYTLKATVIRGQRVTLGKVKKLTKKQRSMLALNFAGAGTRTSTHSPIMLMRTGSSYIPFQRKSTNRHDIKAIKTLSLPQMVSSQRTEQAIQTAINDGLGKRLDHHMERAGMK